MMPPAAPPIGRSLPKANPSSLMTAEVHAYTAASAVNWQQASELEYAHGLAGRCRMFVPAH
jgi:hypothetical protein